jgi:hypothetical protein
MPAVRLNWFMVIGLPIAGALQAPVVTAPSAPGSALAMKVLVLASEPVSAQQLRDALPGDIDPEQGEVMIVAPALQESALRFWFSDADEAIARAEKVREQTEEQLGEAGVSTRSETGESDPLDAIEDALNTFKADRIVLFGSSGSDRYKEIEPETVRERFGLPVDTAGGPST